MRWAFKKGGSEPTHKVLVTGTRGKSSIVRLLQTALVNAGFQSHARITGVVPRHITATGTRVISRSSGAHIEELRWWLKQLPASSQAVVVENSAITPEFQHLAGKWLKPDITILSNTVADHQESWGPDHHCAANILMGGVPRGGRLILPANCKADSHLAELIRQRQCEAVFADPAGDNGQEYHAINLGLAIAAISQLGLATGDALKAMREMPKDPYDFDVIHCHGAELAMAFSANDIISTRSLFKSLQWEETDTRLIYNHRRDRPARLKSFIDWLKLPDWREVIMIGDRPPTKLGSCFYQRVRNKADLIKLLSPGERFFGCGNIAGIPVSLINKDQQSDCLTDTH